MNLQTLPYHILIPALVSLTAFVAIMLKRKRLFRQGGRTWLWLGLSVFFASYFFILTNAMLSGLYAEYLLNAYDLNGDGFFNGSEITPAQQAAMQNVINDTGRNMSFLTGLVFSAMLALVISGSGKVVEYFRG